MKKLAGTIIIVLFAGIALFAYWYHNEYSMEKAESFVQHQNITARKIFIATQGSEYKNKLVRKIIHEPILNTTYISVADVDSLRNLNPQEWDVVLILHTWEMSKAPVAVQNFLVKHPAQENLIIYTTSGSGEETFEDMDGISGASVMIDIDHEADKILTRIKPFI